MQFINWELTWRRRKCFCCCSPVINKPIKISQFISIAQAPQGIKLRIYGLDQMCYQELTISMSY